MNLVERLEVFSEHGEVSAAQISGWSVGQQVLHCCMVVRQVIAALRRSVRTPQEPKLTRAGVMVFEAGQIPRGRGKAPSSVVPEEGPGVERLTAQLAKTRSAMSQLSDLPDEATFEHQYFGTLDRRHAVRFLEIHTEHHLQMIEDILRKSEARLR